MNDKYEKQMKKGVLEMLVLKLLSGEARRTTVCKIRKSTATTRITVITV